MPGRGGRRIGAGRKRPFSERDRYDIGDACESRAWAVAAVELQHSEPNVRIRKSMRLKRPKGYRADIIAVVARDFGASPRMVTRCWVEYRARRRAGNPLAEHSV